MLIRTTIWTDSDLDRAVQVSVTVLDNDWEPVTTATEDVPPGTDVEQALERANDWCRTWVRTYGVQEPLLRP